MRTFTEIFRDHCEFGPNGEHVNGSDRESNHHYGDAYEKIFTYNSPQDDPTGLVKEEYPYSWRKDVELVLEIGNADGSGLLSFVEAFPNAYIVGLDIHPVANRHERVESNLGDAANRAVCERVSAGRRFDVIIDDATHCLKDTLKTLLFLWPSVKPGGVYIVEEMEDVLSLRGNITALWPFAEIVDTVGPSGGTEPLVVLRKPQ